MAFVFTKEPYFIYPAYNDSFIEFTSSLDEGFKAEITVYPVATFPNVFVIFPDSDGVYLFNLKEAVKARFNINGFKDANFFTDIYWKSISGYIVQQIKIDVISPESNEDVQKFYPFYKAVKQIGETVFDKPFQLLTYTADGVNHSLTYFEGFPFHFDIQKATIEEPLIVKSLNNGIETVEMEPTSTGVFRINIDKGGGNNWTTDVFLPLIEGLNRLEVYEREVFKTNLSLTKKKICSGIYLKWFNQNAGYSHYLFEEYFVTKSKAREIERVSNDEFNNINESTGNFKSTGKNAEENISVRAKYESSDYEVLKEIISSPFVQMYTSRTAYEVGRFINVYVEGTISNSNKRGVNEIILNVELAEVLTAKL